MNNKTIPQQTALSLGHKMYRWLSGAFLVIFFWINVQAGFAQISRYPVDANVQLTPPYSVYLSDYVQSATPLIRLNLLLKDQEKFNYQVKLRIRIENIEGLVVRTRPGFVPNPLYLQPNEMLSLTGAEMAPYFNLNNLEITGSGSNEVKRSGKLPESIYTFKVEVLDYSRNQQVSNSAQSMAWIIMGQPPLPLNPLEGEKLEVYDVQRVRLTWAPQHQRLPTMGRIAYRVKVVELPNAQTDANNAILSIPPIVNRLTYDTWFDLDYTATTLVPGKHYAWQIIAQDEDGKSRFKNGGKSPVQRFQYGDLCVGPTNLEAEALDSRRLKISWQANTGNTKYSIRYKEDKPDAEWFNTSDVFINSTTLNDLKPNTRYLYQIQGFCNVVPADFSQTYSIRTAEESQSDFMCGTVPDDWGLDNTDPLQNLQEGDEFFAADFNIKVTKLTATGGQYSGEGLVVIPMMNHMKIKVGYSNIKLNTDYRLIEGQVNVIGGVVQLLDDATRDKIYGIVEDINAVFDQVESGLQDASDIANTISGINETIEDIQNGDDLPDEVQDAIADAEVKLGEAAEALSNGDIDGALEHVKEAADILAEGLGEAGSQPNTPPPGPDGENTVPLSELEPLLVSFREHSQQKFGFDPPREDYALVNYPQKEILGENYKMAYKAVSAAEPENILAEFDGGEEEGAYIGYRTAYMTTTKQGEATEEGQILTVLGVGDGQDDELYAFMKVMNEAGEEEEVETGAMKIAAYQPKTKTIKVVPVNGNNYPYSSATLQNKLNEIYGQAVLQWNVELKNNWEVSGWDENGDNKLDNGGNGLLANYPKEMRNILNAYKNEVGFVDDAYYIFLVNQPENNDRSAYMPRKKQAGFVFVDQYQSEQPLVTTIAHELGHGAFRLEHTFADGTVPQKSTDNLMDYDGGTFLHKYQWDLIHDPVSMLTLLDADEDGAYVSETKSEELARIINFIACAATDEANRSDVHYSWEIYNVELADIINHLDFDNNGSIASDEFKNTVLKLSINDGTPPDATEFFGGTYRKAELSVGEADYSTLSELRIPTEVGNFFFTFENFGSQQNKEAVYSWLLRETGIDGMNAASTYEVSNNFNYSLKKVLLFSPCQLDNLSRNNRVELITYLFNNIEDAFNLDRDTYQFLLVNILKTIPENDKEYFYNHFRNNPDWIAEIYNNVADNVTLDFIQIWLELWGEFYENNSATISQSGKLIIKENIFDNASNIASINDEGKTTFIEPYSHNQETVTLPYYVNNPFDLVYLYKPELGDDKPYLSLPAFAALYFIDQENVKTWEDLGWTGVNVALFAVGIGEVYTGIRAAAVAAEASGLISRQFLVASARSFLGVGDIATSITTGVCSGDNTEFCQWWSRYQTLIEVGLLTASVADGIYMKLRANYPSFKSNQELTDGQISYLQDDLGLLEDLGSDIIRGVSKSSFKNSFTASDEIAEQAWILFKNEDWSGLENLFNAHNLNDLYPPNDGFISFAVEPLSAGTKIDRYGGYIDDVTGELKDQGKFFANDGEALTNRALPSGSENKIYSQYEVLNDIPDTKIGEAIPWFGENGKGIQYQVERSTDWLIQNGYIRRLSTTAPAAKVLSSTASFNRGSRNFSLIQGDASSGWKHIYDRHIDVSRFPNKTKFINGLSEYEVKDLLSKTLKHGSESQFQGLSVFEYRTSIRGVYKKYRATVNVDGTVRTFHPLD